MIKAKITQNTLYSTKHRTLLTEQVDNLDQLNQILNKNRTIQTDSNNKRNKTKYYHQPLTARRNNKN